ncbi:hypothetical protein [Acrocarpospora phusangensis]|nr:hypothetical protein [Acrocarpospora phusangensis]
MTRPAEVEVITWMGDNLDDVVEFLRFASLGPEYAGVRVTENRVKMLLLNTPDNPVTPVQVRPGWKLVRLEGTVTAWAPETFAVLFERVG